MTGWFLGRSTQNSRNSGHLHPTPDCHSIAEDQNGPSGPVATGPDPFPYRVPKVSHLYKNSLMVEFTDQLDEKNHRPEECYIKDDFSLGDFLLKERSKCQFLAFLKIIFLEFHFWIFLAIIFIYSFSWKTKSRNFDSELRTELST